jgi:hypothetical protein
MRPAITPEQTAAYYEAKGLAAGEQPADLVGDPCELCDYDGDCYRCVPSDEDESAAAA